MRPSEFPLPKGNPASAYMLDNLEEKRDKFSIRNNAYVLSEAIIRSSSRGGGEGLVKVVEWGCGVGGWTVMARRKGSLWHDPLVVVGAEENNGDVVDGRNSALRGGRRARIHA